MAQPERAEPRSAPSSSSQASARDPVRVLYVGGLGRSGSTLVDRMLGQVPGFVSGGEIRDLWQRGLIENRLCGCGVPFRDCAYWREVGREAFGGWSKVDPAAVAALARSVERASPLARRSGPGRARRERYGRIVVPLYRAIREVSGEPVVVDSSKDAVTAALLADVPGVDLRVIHLVRDPRGVAHSWARRVVRPDVVGRTEYMYRFGPSRVGVRWVARNLGFERLARRGVPTIRMRYERLVQAPREELARALALAGRPPGPSELEFVHPGSVELQANHTAMGNPLRMVQGPLELRVDDEWKSAMGPFRRAVVTALTGPWLSRYGYARDGTLLPEPAP